MLTQPSPNSRPHRRRAGRPSSRAHVTSAADADRLEAGPARPRRAPVEQRAEFRVGVQIDTRPATDRATGGKRAARRRLYARREMVER